jgi:hypothetical protein
MNEQDDKRLLQRNFYLYMSPFEGHDLAEEHGGFSGQSDDIAEAETADILKFWLTLQSLDAGEIIADCAWWMTRMVDPEGRGGADGGVEMLDQYTAYAVSVMKQLLDKNVIAFTKVPDDLPEFRLDSGQSFNDKDMDVLTFLQQLFEEGNEDE